MSLTGGCLQKEPKKKESKIQMDCRKKVLFRFHNFNFAQFIKKDNFNWIHDIVEFVQFQSKNLFDGQISE